jgi:hypothetical protein
MYIDTAIYRFKDNAGNLYTENEVMDFILAGYQEEDFEEIEIEVEVEFDGEWRDEGIGEYEYWGIRGRDVCWCYEVDELDSVMDKDGKDWSDELTDDEYKSIVEECEEYGKDYDD